MEKELGSSGIFSWLRANIFNSRFGTIAVAVGLIIDSAKTIGVIIANGLSSDDHIPSLSLAAAGFQLLLGVVVLIAEIIVTILARTDTLSRKRNIQIFDIVFSIAGVFIFVGIAIVYAVFAAVLQTSCDAGGCAASVSVVAVSAGVNLVQAAMFGYIISKTIYTIVKNKKT